MIRASASNVFGARRGIKKFGIEKKAIWSPFLGVLNYLTFPLMLETSVVIMPRVEVGPGHTCRASTRLS